MGQPIPFTEEDQISVLGESDAVPGHPHILLSDATAVMTFLDSELSTNRLGERSKILYLTSKPRNISPLHHQAIKGRKILITERPDLHLLVSSGHILVKPLPICLMSHAFYANYIVSTPNDDRLAKEAHGFLRTYASLIVHESDLEIAKKNLLIPARIEWAGWCGFIRQLKYPSSITEKGVPEARNVGSMLVVDMPPMYSDDLVARRYHYGELGLLRLNLYSALYLWEWEYFPVHFEYHSYFSRYLTPYLFLFGALTVVLGAIQVAGAANHQGYSVDHNSGFVRFAVAVTGIGVAFFPAMSVVFTIRELYLYYFHRRGKI